MVWEISVVIKDKDLEVLNNNSDEKYMCNTERNLREIVGYPFCTDPSMVPTYPGTSNRMSYIGFLLSPFSITSNMR